MRGSKSKRPSLASRGALNDDVKDYIDRYHERMSAQQIADSLGQPQRAHVIQSYINTRFGESRRVSRDTMLAEELETRPEWKQLEDQFTPRELEHFRHRYVQLMGQFGDEIAVTDEMQIFHLITIDILIQRIMAEQKMANRDLVLAHDQIEKCTSRYEKSNDPLDMEEVKYAEARYTKASDALRGLTRQYDSYSMRQSAILKELKGTRDQRIKIVENSKQSFIGLLRLLAEEDQRAIKGREAEMMKLAAEKNAAELARPHQYADGAVDQPLLTPETVVDYD